MRIRVSPLMNSTVAIGYLMLGPLAASTFGQARGEDQTAMFTMDPSVVASINGEPVTTDEYKLVMQRSTAKVFAWFREHRNLEDHPGYWSDSNEGETPIAMLRQVTLQELAGIKVCQTLAREKGLLPDSSYQSFEIEFRKENERRTNIIFISQS